MRVSFRTSRGCTWMPNKSFQLDYISLEIVWSRNRNHNQNLIKCTAVLCRAASVSSTHTETHFSLTLNLTWWQILTVVIIQKYSVFVSFWGFSIKLRLFDDQLKTVCSTFKKCCLFLCITVKLIRNYSENRLIHLSQNFTRKKSTWWKPSLAAADSVSENCTIKYYFTIIFIMLIIDMW